MLTPDLESPGSSEEKGLATMEPKVICVLLVVFSLACGSLAQVQTETCVMPPSQRSNCGFPGVTPAECAAKGCCFDSTVPGHPWCFYPLTINNNLPEEECEF